MMRSSNLPQCADPEGGAAVRVGSVVLERFQNGEIDPDEFLTLKVEEAVAHLRTSLRERDVELVRMVLADLVVTDPVLATMMSRIACTAML